MADLNIGIVTAIWAINPFMIAVLEWIIYRQRFDCNQMWGMALLVLCAVIVSLSEIAIPKDDANVVISTGSGAFSVTVNDVDSETEKIPVFAAVLGGLLLPILCTFFVMVLKYVDEEMRMRATDFSIAYWGIMSLAFQIAAAFSFRKEFDLSLWINGFVGSFLNALGCMFVIAAYHAGHNSGQSAGIVSALVSS